MIQNSGPKLFIIIAVLALLTSSAQAIINIETVPVRNPGNAGEYSGAGAGGTGQTTICGDVDYAYNIGKYEVTAGEYCDFLNAVAATDTYGLYNPDMDSNPYGCQITQSGENGNYTYDFSGRPCGDESDWANRPVNRISWYDTLRFANWLHNGQPNGPQTANTTEDGAYDMSLGASVVRKPGALFFLPNEDEWYKAAYHKNDGVTGNYFDYPTYSDSTPSNDLVEPIDPGNTATFYDYGYTIDSPYRHTTVGAHENSCSPYGTFDQGGNIVEWTETGIYGSYRCLRGGSSSWTGQCMHASYRGNSYYLPTLEGDDLGFRIATVVPEPGTITLLICGLASLVCWRRWW